MTRGEAKRYVVILLMSTGLFFLSILPLMSADNRVPVSSADNIGSKDRRNEHCRTCIQVKQQHESLTFGRIYDIKNNCALNTKVWYKCDQNSNLTAETPRDCNITTGCPMFSGDSMSQTMPCHYGSGITWECEYTETLEDKLKREGEKRSDMKAGKLPVSEEEYALLFGKTPEEVFLKEDKIDVGLQEYERVLQQASEDLERQKKALDAWREEKAMTLSADAAHAQAEAEMVETERESADAEKKRAAAERRARARAEAEREEAEDMRAEQQYRNAQQIMGVIGSTLGGITAGRGGKGVSVPNTQGMGGGSQSTGSSSASATRCNAARAQVAEYDRLINEMSQQLNRPGGYGSGTSQANATLNTYKQERQVQQNLITQNCR